MQEKSTNIDNQKLNVIRWNPSTDNYPIGQADSYSDSILEDDEIVDMIEKMENHFPSAEYGNYEDVDNYRVIYSGKDIGYYSSAKGRLSNFHIVFSKWIISSHDNAPFSFYEGEIFLSDGSIKAFKKMPVSVLENNSALKKYIANICGPKVIIEKPAEVVKAIKTFNATVKCYEEQEFGYDNKLTCFYTEELIITIQDIIEDETPIKYADLLEQNKLRFKYASLETFKRVREFLIDKLLKWDDPKIIYNLLSFTFYPLIYPFLKQINPNKFYLMLIGKSGSGKTQISKWMQRFYGIFNSLDSWTSTPTSIAITGTAYKDALFLIDDLKPQNFKTKNDAKEVMALIQNYSDGTSKKRGNPDMRLKEERLIKGHLLITAEDVLITESSSVARGIIIEVESKPVKKNELLELDRMSAEFSTIMPYYIQYLLRNLNEEKVTKIYNSTYESIYTRIRVEDISPDNLPRALNNFAALKTSWEIMSGFLLENKTEEVRIIYKTTFDENLIVLLKENLERIKSQKPEEIFENKFWDLVENGTLSFKQVLPDGNILEPVRGKVVGHFAIGKDNNIRLIIQLSTIVKEIRNRESNFSISERVLEKILCGANKIRTTKGGRFSLNGQKPRGVEWVGDFSKRLFGIDEDGSA